MTIIINNHASTRPLSRADAKLLLSAPSTEGRSELLRELQAHGYKWCPKCGTVHPLSEYQKDSRRFDGLHLYCRGCERDRQRVNRAKRKAAKAQAAVV